MKFRISLLFLVFAIGSSIFGMEQRYQKGQNVDLNGIQWTVSDVQDCKSSNKRTNETRRITYNFERPYIPYLLNLQFKYSDRGTNKTEPKASKDKVSYKLTPLGGVTLSGIGLLALYGLYSYFKK